MQPIIKAAKQIQDFLEEFNWKFCFIGGLALQRWGKPRLTNDIDLTLLTGFGAEDKFLDALLQKYQSRLSDAKNFALKSRVLLLETESGIGIDIALGALYFEENAVNRASYFEYLPNISLKTCSAEDLVIYKAFANRLQDWADLENITIKQKNLDWNYIRENLLPLLELGETPEIMIELENLHRRIAKG